MIKNLAEVSLTAREQKIYDLLSDDISRETFIKISRTASYWRKNYNKIFCTDLPLNLFYSDFDETISSYSDIKATSIERIIEVINNHKCIQYGFGSLGKNIAKYLSEAGVYHRLIGLYDKNPISTGNASCRLNVKTPPENLRDYPDFDYVILTVGSVKNIRQVGDYFKKLGVSEDRILIFSVENNRHKYFNEDIILPRLGSQEVFIDAGCFDFSDSELLLKYAPGVKKIYAFEPDPDYFERIKKSALKFDSDKIVLGNFAWWSEETFLEFGSGDSPPDCSVKIIETRTIDGVVQNDENVTYIKMELEGAELESLKGGEETVRRCKPNMAISVYHNHDDYLDLTEYVLSLNPDYKLFFRQSYPYFILESTAYFVK
jgi:FkbM family methyltransferase